MFIFMDNFARHSLQLAKWHVSVKKLYFNEIRFRFFFVSLLRLSSTAPLLLIIIHFCIFNHYRNIYASRLHRKLKVNVSIYQWIPVLAKYSAFYYSSNNVVTVHLINMISVTINLHNISQSVTHVGQKGGWIHWLCIWCDKSLTNFDD